MFPIILKALTFLPFGGFLRGGSLKMIGILGLVAVVAFGYFKWKGSIQAEVREQENIARLEQIAADQQRQTEILLDVTERQNAIIKAAIDRNQKIIKALQAAKIQIGAMEASPATAPLEATMEILRQLEQQGVRVEQAKKEIQEQKPTGNSSIDAWRQRLFGGGE